MDMSKIVSAADLEKYAYCPLSWWLSRKTEDEEKGENEIKGMERHREIETKINDIAIKEKETRNMEKTVLIFSLVATTISMMGMVIWLPHSRLMSGILLAESLLWLIFSLYFLTLLERSGKENKILERLIILTSIASIVVAIYSLGFVFPENELLGNIMEVSALTWLMVATLILWRELYIENRVWKERKSIQLPEGQIIYTDLDDGTSEIMESTLYGIRGRPDHILLKDGHYIPVELKTGRTPRGPLFSHIVQLGAYCLILEDITRKSPPYGILKYPERSFEIEFTEELKEIVLKKRDELLRDLEKGEAHRNHHRVGKCRACSRRRICPERLE